MSDRPILNDPVHQDLLAALEESRQENARLRDENARLSNHYCNELTKENLLLRAALEASEWVICGSTYQDPELNACIEALRENEGYEVGLGCKRRLKVMYAYRCVDCGRWFHRDCILKHFAVNGDHKAESLRTAERRIASLKEAIGEWRNSNCLLGGALEDVRKPLNSIIADLDLIGMATDAEVLRQVRSQIDATFREAGRNNRDE